MKNLPTTKGQKLIGKVTQRGPKENTYDPFKNE